MTDIDAQGESEWPTQPRVESIVIHDVKDVPEALRSGSSNRVDVMLKDTLGRVLATAQIEGLDPSFQPEVQQRWGSTYDLEGGRAISRGAIIGVLSVINEMKNRTE